MTDAQKLSGRIKQLLKDGKIEAYDFEVAVLLEHFCALTKEDILFSDKKPVNEELLLLAVQKRLSGYPLQYIIGEWEFYGLDFKVCEGVLIPRADTETLIDYALSKYSDNIRILDMCCGTGCIGLTLKKHLPKASVTLCDISDTALDITRQNAQKHGLLVDVLKADLFEGPEKYFKENSFDIIISNPPYIKSADIKDLSKEVQFEPRLALDGGKEGMDCYTALCEKWQNALAPEGELILESGYDTAESIVTLMTELCYCDITTKKDYSGITRLVSGKKPYV